MPDAPHILLDEVSPSGSVKAALEATDATLYLYLGGADDTDFGLRRVWVANLAPAPDALDTTGLAEGQPVMMPTQACAHPDGRALPDKADLSLLWFEEGDAVALFEKDQALAVIPGWSGVDGFTGYARDCTSPTPLAVPLGTRDDPVDPAVFERLDRSLAFWQWCESNPWPDVRDGLIGWAESHFGPHRNYWTIDGGYWPPRAMIECRPDASDFAVFLTVGMSLRAMPRAEHLAEDPARVRRIELAFAIEKSLADAAGQAIATYLCAHANLPWERITCLQAGHLLGASRLLRETGHSDAFPHALLREDPPGAPGDRPPDVFGDPVRVLWLTPVTDAERDWAEASGPDALAAALAEAGVSMAFHPRSSIA